MNILPPNVAIYKTGLWYFIFKSKCYIKLTNTTHQIHRNSSILLCRHHFEELIASGISTRGYFPHWRHIQGFLPQGTHFGQIGIPAKRLVDVGLRTIDILSVVFLRNVLRLNKFLGCVMNSEKLSGGVTQTNHFSDAWEIDSMVWKWPIAIHGCTVWYENGPSQSIEK